MSKPKLFPQTFEPFLFHACVQFENSKFLEVLDWRIWSAWPGDSGLIVASGVKCGDSGPHTGDSGHLPRRLRPYAASPIYRGNMSEKGVLLPFLSTPTPLNSTATAPPHDLHRRRVHAPRSAVPAAPSFLQGSGIFSPTSWTLPMADKGSILS